MHVGTTSMYTKAQVPKGARCGKYLWVNPKRSKSVSSCEEAYQLASFGKVAIELGNIHARGDCNYTYQSPSPQSYVPKDAKIGKPLMVEARRKL